MSSKTNSASANDTHFGFLSVVDLGGDVVIGGCLILNTLGRPLEFHCTEPVKPNRAQRILYGNTLRPFVCGDQIGASLIKHSRTTLSMICTDIPEVASVRTVVDVPLFVLAPDRNACVELEAATVGSTHGFIDRRYAADAEQCERVLSNVVGRWELTEPFERIHEALSEIQKAA